jgi:hypothetical protein
MSEDGGRRRWYLAAAALVLSLGLSLANCGTGTTTGSALVAAGISADATETYGTMPPGEELGVLFITVVNRSSSTLTMNSVAIHGPGFGSVVSLLQVEAAPLCPSCDKSVPGGAYSTDPPVAGISLQACGVQTLLPWAGYKLNPGAAMRIFELIKADRPGSYHSSGATVDYEENGQSYHQWIATGAEGRVSPSVKPLGLESTEAPCLARTRELPQ